MGQFTWTDERIEELKQLYQTHSSAQIAAKLGGGISRCAVIGKASRLGLTAPQRENKPKVPRSENANKNRSGERHAIFKVIRANGNSDHMKVIQTSKFAESPRLRCVEIVPRHLTLQQLEAGDCRYPYGGETEVGYATFCGHPIQAESSYCPSHHALCRIPPAPRRDSAPRYFGTDFGKRVFG